MTILTLSGCSKCEDLKNLLHSKKYKYEELVCSDSSNSNVCDSYESIAKCDLYPMIIVDDKIFLCFTSDYNKLNKVHSTGRFSIVYCHSTDNMLQYLAKLVY